MGLILAVLLIFLAIVFCISGMVFVCSAFIQISRIDYPVPERLSRMNTVGFVLNNTAMVLGALAVVVSRL